MKLYMQHKKYDWPVIWVLWKEVIECESVKGFCVEPRTLHQQDLRLNELSFEIEASDNPEIVNK